MNELFGFLVILYLFCGFIVWLIEKISEIRKIIINNLTRCAHGVFGGKTKMKCHRCIEEEKRKHAEREAIKTIAEKAWQSEIEPIVTQVLLKESEMRWESAWDAAESAWANAGSYKEKAAWRVLEQTLLFNFGGDTKIVYEKTVDELVDNMCKAEAWIIPWKTQLENDLEKEWIVSFHIWKEKLQKQLFCLKNEEQGPMAAKIEGWKKERPKRKRKPSTKQEYEQVQKNVNEKEPKQEVKRESEQFKPKAAEAIRNANANAVVHDVKWDAKRAKQEAVKEVIKEGREREVDRAKQVVDAAIKANKKEEQRQGAQEWLDKWINKEEAARKPNNRNKPKENKIELQKRVDREVGDDVDAAVVLEGVCYTKQGSDKVELMCNDELLKKASEKAVFVEGKEFIYVIQNSVTKSVKIGYANNPYRRLAELQTSNEFILILKGCIKGNVTNERTIQAFFKKYNIFNEWFEFSNPIKEYVSRANLFIPTLKTSEVVHGKASQFDVRALEGISRVEPGSKTKIQINTKGDIGVGFDKVEVRKKSFVYLIQNTVTKSVKIGYAANPYSRWAQLQTGNENVLFLLGCIAGDMEKEAKIHQAFSQYKKMGEWFSFNDHIEKFILTAKQNGKLIYPNVK